MKVMSIALSKSRAPNENVRFIREPQRFQLQLLRPKGDKETNNLLHVSFGLSVRVAQFLRGRCSGRQTLIFDTYQSLHQTNVRPH